MSPGSSQRSPLERAELEQAAAGQRARAEHVAGAQPGVARGVGDDLAASEVLLARRRIA